MKFKAIILLSGTLALVACGPRDETANADLNLDTNLALDNEAANDSMAAAPTTSQGFANAAAASDRFEIESSRLAATAGQSAAIKKFAAQMVTAHTESTAKLKTAAAALSPPVTADDTLPPPLQQKLDSLRGLQGAEFDSAYAAAQVEAHQKALDMLKGYAASGDNPKLKELASGLVPKVTAHLNMANGLK